MFRLYNKDIFAAYPTQATCSWTSPTTVHVTLPTSLIPVSLAPTGLLTPATATSSSLGFAVNSNAIQDSNGLNAGGDISVTVQNSVKSQNNVAISVSGNQYYVTNCNPILTFTTSTQGLTNEIIVYTSSNNNLPLIRINSNTITVDLSSLLFVSGKSSVDQFESYLHSHFSGSTNVNFKAVNWFGLGTTATVVISTYPIALNILNYQQGQQKNISLWSALQLDAAWANQCAYDSNPLQWFLNGNYGNVIATGSSLSLPAYYLKGSSNTLTVRGGGGLYSSSVVVNTIPSVPVMSAAGSLVQTLAYNSAVTLDFSSSNDIDYNTPVTSFSWSCVTSNGGPCGSINTTAFVGPVQTINGLPTGTYIFTVVGTGSLGLSASISTTVTLLAQALGNPPNVIVSSASGPVIDPTQINTISSTVTYEGGGSPSYFWTLNNGQQLSLASGANAPAIAIAANSLSTCGTYTITLAVTYTGATTSVSGTGTVTISTYCPPSGGSIAVTPTFGQIGPNNNFTINVGGFNTQFGTRSEISSKIRLTSQ